MIALEPDRAYRLWAPTYDNETAISLIENDLAEELSPPVAGERLLDAGCGTGRRLERVQAALAVGIDRCREMLMARGEPRVAVADVRALPVPSDFFDVIWCRLVLGHIDDPLPAYRELARVCRPGGRLFVSDFHADAVAAGHSRSFRDESGQLHAVEHHVHDTDSHLQAAREAGFAATERRDGTIGDRVRHLYVRAGRDAQYKTDFGLPVVASFLFVRAVDAPAD
ncbi:MAG TPA: class I SAM-dependent methyltransferase [Rhizomicrobium sp.]|nr:class I SAM-dependent methyltransferase [Rhizomicrobium sp.]